MDITTVASSVGIEVALNHDAEASSAMADQTPDGAKNKKTPQKPPTSPKKTVVSFQRELISREKVRVLSLAI